MLLTLTIVSLLAAIGFGWYAWRLRQEERFRSAARVAALAGAIDAVEEASYGARYSAPPVAVNSLFAPEHSAARRGAPLVKLAVGAAMGVALLVAIAMSNRGATSEMDPGAASLRPASSQAGAPLELISMRHVRDGSTLKVTGLVRNPRGGRTIGRVTAVVFAFNRAGAFVTSASAGVDFTALDPGDESPFVVTIPGLADVGRYRVSFRTEAGVLRHVDRRADQMRLASTGAGLIGAAR